MILGSNAPTLMMLEGEPEEIGIWPIIAKIAAGAVKVVGGGIAKKVRGKRKRQAAKKKAAKLKKQQAALLLQQQITRQRQEAEKKKQITNLLIPLGLAAATFLMGRKP